MTDRIITMANAVDRVSACAVLDLKAIFLVTGHMYGILVDR